MTREKQLYLTLWALTFLAFVAWMVSHTPLW